MRFHTIEENFDYRMIESLKKMLEAWERPIESFTDAEELFDWLDQHKESFGRIVIDDMVSWQSEEEWVEELN